MNETTQAPQAPSGDVPQSNNSKVINYVKFICFSVFGVILFFTPITIKEKSSIPLDHLIQFLKEAKIPIGEKYTLEIFFLLKIFVLIVATIGGILPWMDKSFKRNTLCFILSVLRTLGIPVCIMGFFSIGPGWLNNPNFIPFAWQKIAVDVTIIVTFGSIFLTFIMGYGLLEFTGVIVRPIMRPLYKVPGKAAINAIAAFIGNFSVAMFLTDELYKESKYTYREAAIVMTGFSTVSATFMIVIAKTAGFMDIWNFYFWSTLLITFTVTAITVRLYPLNKLDNSYIDGVGKPEKEVKGNIIHSAINEGVKAAAQSKSLLKSLWTNLKGGMRMCFVLTPSATAVGLLAAVLANKTKFFEVVGIVFMPITYVLKLFGMENYREVAKASAVVLGEVFVPNLTVKELPDVPRYIIAVVSVSTIIFFAGFIPCLYATSIKLKPWQLLLIWFERAALSIILAGIVGLIYFR
ncbi:MAG: YjiH family protein [Sedimentisphaerales bacterium]|nr:YjiH family protein [Sedimentisphaerales bacterium]